MKIQDILVFMMKCSVLIVEDEEDLREVYRLFLEELNCDIFEAQDGVQALSMLESQTFQLMITDLNMPNLNGLDLINRVRQIEKHNEMKIFVLSANIDSNENLNAKTNGFLHKPVEKSELIQLIQKEFVIV